MAGQFTSTVTALWTLLELGSPAFATGAEVVLTIDGIDLRLTDTPDERHLLLTGVAGHLAADARTSAAQVRALLQRGLGYLGSSRACISLLEVGKGPLTVLVQAIYPHDAGQMNILVKIIHELLLVLEFARSELTTSAPLAVRRQSQTGLQESVIFLP